MAPPKVARSAARASRRCTIGLFAAVLSACGPLRPRAPQPEPAVAAAADAAAAVTSRVREAGAFPTEAVLGDRVVLYTEMLQDLDERLARLGQAPQFRSRRPLDLDLSRDTIRGRGPVLAWLERRRDRWDDSIPFSLRTTRIYRCDGVVLQYGRYLVPRRDAELMDAARTHPIKRVWIVPFAARWRASSGGTLQIEAIWLGPREREVQPARLAENCTDAEELVFNRRYARRRWAVEAAVGYTLLEGAPGVVEDAARELGWRGELKGVAPLWAELGVLWRIRPGWQVEGLGSYQAPAKVEHKVAPLYIGALSWTTVTPGVLLVRALGPLRVGAGPAVSFTRWEWSDNVATRPSTSRRSVLPGGLAEVGYVQTFQSHIYLHLRARYGWFGETETPGFQDLAPVTVPMSGVRVSLSVGYWW